MLSTVIVTMNYVKDVLKITDTVDLINVPTILLIYSDKDNSHPKDQSFNVCFILVYGCSISGGQ